jgi:diacylglycerol kinase family enzyme
MAPRSKPQTIEYAFRFAKGTNTEQARMVEMIRVNLCELLKMIQPTTGGEAVHIDGFYMRTAPEVFYALDQPVSQETDHPA